MTIEPTILRNMNAHRRESDTRRIALKLGVSGEIVRKALRTGKCSEKIYQALTEFYAARAREVDDIISLTETVNDEK